MGEDGAQVVVDSTGKLGTSVEAPSSRRVKDGIREMDTATAGLLKLRPVTFRYIPGHGDGGQRLQYGLIAEEVAEIYPELVWCGTRTASPQACATTCSRPCAERAAAAAAALGGHVRRQQRQLEVQERERQAEKAQTEARLTARQTELDELRAQVRALVRGRVQRTD